MPIIRIDKSIVDEIENEIERSNKMHENQSARARKLSDSVEKMYTQELKKLRSQLQQKENIIKEVREKLLCYGETFDLKVHQEMQKELLKILDKID